MIIQKYREVNASLYTCFIDYFKAFDSVNHQGMWNLLREMDFDPKIIFLIRSLYEGEQSAMQLECGTTEWFPVTKGVRQGCILSPHLFSIYTEGIMREVEHDHRKEEYDEPSLQGLPIRDLRYADDTALLATTSKGLETLIKSVKDHSEQKGLLLNLKKTKIMDIDKRKGKAVITSDGEEIERVSNFNQLGAQIEANGKSTPEIKRRLAIAGSNLRKMARIGKGQSICTKLRILRCIVFPIASYGCEAWTINNTDGKKITAFEIKSYRKNLRLSWTEKTSNEIVSSRIKKKAQQFCKTLRKLSGDSLDT